MLENVAISPVDVAKFC